jgi:hypothetical protein
MIGFKMMKVMRFIWIEHLDGCCKKFAQNYAKDV